MRWLSLDLDTCAELLEFIVERAKFNRGGLTGNRRGSCIDLIKFAEFDCIDRFIERSQLELGRQRQLLEIGPGDVYRSFIDRSCLIFGSEPECVVGELVHKARCASGDFMKRDKCFGCE